MNPEEVSLRYTAQNKSAVWRLLLRTVSIGGKFTRSYRSKEFHYPI